MKVQKYYCKRCEDFFSYSATAPRVCPICFSTDILGPIIVDEYEYP